MDGCIDGWIKQLNSKIMETSVVGWMDDNIYTNK